MQAIQSKILPATNFKPTRIKAWCARGHIIRSSDGIEGMNADASKHGFVANLLCERFAAEDAKEYGSDPLRNPWMKPRVAGCLPNGDFAHVFSS